MRKAFISMVAFGALVSGWAARASEVPFLPRACTVEGPSDIARTADCQRITYRYGPLQVTPGDNLIMFGPVTVEKPVVDGYVVRFKPDMELTDGTIPGVDIIHLHHAVWQSSAFGDPVFASGEEKTIVSIPNGYGIHVGSRDVWLLNYMLHNQTPSPYNVFITYTVDFIPKSSSTGGSVVPVKPHWLDVGSYNGFNPIYNTARGSGSLVPGECSFPKENCAAHNPFGGTMPGNGEPGNGIGRVTSVPAGTIVWMGGHLHPGGLRDDVELMRGSARIRVFTSDAVYWDYANTLQPGGPPVSWDMSSEVTAPTYRLRVSDGDKLVLNSVYESARASWYEGMGIVVTFIAEGDTSGPDPFAQPVDPDNTVLTHGHLTEAGRHGGPDGAALPPITSVPTDTVAIGAFRYAVGDLSLRTPSALGPQTMFAPSVAAGTSLNFVNTDAPALIFHTITACRAPCNGDSGLSYPLADGAPDFDSYELGFGPPGVTAAANTATYALDTTGMNGTYTYFCRVHPFMRGAFVVT